MSIVKKFFCASCLLITVLVVGFIYFIFWGDKSFVAEKIISTDFVKQQVGDENSDLVQLAPRFLGFTKPMTYLILFANNTELRPGGGFIGSYAVVKIDQGKMEIIKVEGTEVIDRDTPEDWRPTPPQVLKDHLKVDRWYFRDANWSPDFVVSARKALEFYQGEGGVEANNIDAVVAITPTVLEELLKTVGPIEVQGIEFTAENVTEKLEYEVEYGYDEKGIHFLERKKIMEPFMAILLGKIKNDVWFKINNYVSLVSRLALERQIMVYSTDAEIQTIIKDKNWSGEVKNVAGDYLLWVDANLAALKTDHAMNRELKYSIQRDETGRLVASAEMVYNHTGKFDWRTSRYRTYTRIFVPVGSELISVDGAMKWDRNSLPGIVDQGEELNKKWFGTFISIEPGETKTLKFTYYLPDNIDKNNLYTLFVQKQLGTLNHKLTLNLNFGTNIVAAEPAEIESEWGDGVYKFQGDLRLDQNFQVNFKL